MLAPAEDHSDPNQVGLVFVWMFLELFDREAVASTKASAAAECCKDSN